MNVDLIKAAKGTAQYEEWLRKYLLKRLRKQQTKDNNENNNSDNKTFASAIKLADSIIDKSIKAAGEPTRGFLDVLDRLGRSNDEGKSRVTRIKEQISALLENCPDSNFEFKSLEENYVRKQNFEGAESLLFMQEGLDFIIKVQDFSVQSDTPEEYLVNRIVIHNSIFRNCQYQVHGYTFDELSDHPRFRFIVSQPLIKGRAATNKEISDYMTKLGFAKDTKNEGDYILGELRISDLNPRNVLVDTNNQVYVIDEVIHISSKESLSK